MSTITTIAAGDLITNSRTDINANFANLNADKFETSNVDTDTTLAANSDSKVASQKATKTYIDSLVASTTTCKTAVPMPLCRTAVTNNASTFATATTGWFGLVNFPFKITATQVIFYVQVVNTSGALKLGLYSEDGQTQILSLTSGTISGTGTVALTFTATEIPAGNYYIVAVPVSTVSLDILTYTTFLDTNNFLINPTSQPVMMGTATVTSGTLPATFTPSTLTASDAKLFITRFDD